MEWGTELNAVKPRRVRRGVVVLVVLVLFAGLEWVQWRDDRAVEAKLHRDVAAVEEAAGRLTYDEVSTAWTEFRLSRSTRFVDLHDSVAARWTTAYEDEGAIILVFRSEDTCVDLLVRPKVNTVRTRDCS
jgi:hypothetical protein